MIFVVDACVAHSMCGPDPHNKIDPLPKNCREILMEIYSQSHEIAISEKLFEEYKNNASRFFNEWLVMMISKSLIKYINRCENYELRERIEKNIRISHKVIQDQDAIIGIVLKDVHLLESALATDNFIISNDNRSKKHLIKLMQIDDKKLGLTLIFWATTDEVLINWLKDGANYQKIPNDWNLDTC